MGPTALGVLLSAVGLLLFGIYRPRSRPRLGGSAVLPDRPAAIRDAGARVRELTGVDVTGWPAFAVPSSEAVLLQQAHQLDIVAEVAPLLLRWGLLYGWRVRFCGPRDTIAVGLGGNGGVNFLQVTGPPAQRAHRPRPSHAACCPAPGGPPEIHVSPGRRRR
jgi:hypothetical protein